MPSPLTTYGVEDPRLASSGRAVEKGRPGLARLRGSCATLIAGISILCASGFVAPNLSGMSGRQGPSNDASRWSFDEWIRWRDTQIGRLLEPSLPHGDEVVVARQAIIDRSVE